MSEIADLLSQESTLRGILADLDAARALERSGIEHRLAMIAMALEEARAQHRQAERFAEHRAARLLVRP